MALVLKSGTFAIEARHGYVHVVHPGALSSEDEVQRYAHTIEQEVAKHGVRRVLVDARNEPAEESTEVRAALWRWLGVTRAIDAIAIVARDELVATRINMTALSQRLSIRAHDDSTSAVRWLTRVSQNKSTGAFRAVTGDETGPGRIPAGLRRTEHEPSTMRTATGFLRPQTPVEGVPRSTSDRPAQPESVIPGAETPVPALERKRG